MSSARFILCLLLSTIALSAVAANEDLRAKRAVVAPILSSVGAPVNDLLGTVGEVYCAFPALCFLQELFNAIDVQKILTANGQTVDSIAGPIIGTIVKPKAAGATGVTGATGAPVAPAATTAAPSG